METKNTRLLSLDVLRGLIMILLMLESTRLFSHLITLTEGSFVHSFFIQLEHHPWHGLRFWDLVQPGFMFIAGTALAFSLHHQNQKGIPWSQSLTKALKRSGWLFFWGVLDYAVHPQGLSFELWDVLTQLSFTSLIAFLIFRWPSLTQLLFCGGLLLLTEVLYRFTHIPGFDLPFTDQHNFGNYIDLLLMGKINSGGWVAINCVPTAVHTIGGALAGKLLLSEKTRYKKIKILVLAGLLCLAAGFALDATVTPIIKRIATSSFVLASGGWCLLALAFCYGWVDVFGHQRFTQFIVVISMNSLFIYLFIEIVGNRWFNDYTAAISNGLMILASVPVALMNLLTPLITFILEWKMCEFLFNKKIFFKI